MAQALNTVNSPQEERKILFVNRRSLSDIFTRTDNTVLTQCTVVLAADSRTISEFAKQMSSIDLKATQISSIDLKTFVSKRKKDKNIHGPSTPGGGQDSEQFAIWKDNMHRYNQLTNC
eukprot:691341_1